MKRLLILISIILVSRNTIAQSSFVNVEFEVDGKKSTYKNAIVKFIKSTDTIRVNIIDGKLPIPSSFIKKRAIVVFYIEKYILKFDSIPVTWNNAYPKWTVGVDEKPFDKKEHAMIKSWKNVEIVYYLKNADGRRFTVDNFKKSNVISK